MGVTSWVISQELPCGPTSVGVGCACCTLRLKVAWALTPASFRKPRHSGLSWQSFSQDWGREGRSRRREEWLAGDSLGVGVGGGEGVAYIAGQVPPGAWRVRIPLCREGGQGPTNGSSLRPSVWRGPLRTGQGCLSFRTP